MLLVRFQCTFFGRARPQWPLAAEEGNQRAQADVNAHDVHGEERTKLQPEGKVSSCRRTRQSTT
eukprot:scaffold109230_cov62-Phaeocystis_antarctica.AAC.1